MISAVNTLKLLVVGCGMIFDETMLQLLLNLIRSKGFYDGARHGIVMIQLIGIVSQTGRRAELLRQQYREVLGDFANLHGDGAMAEGLALRPDVVYVATPDDKHFGPALAAIEAGANLLVEKPTVLRLDQLDALTEAAKRSQVFATTVQHKRDDPAHARIRLMFKDGKLGVYPVSTVSRLYEPLSIAQEQFGAWVDGRNPFTYVGPSHWGDLLLEIFGGDLTMIRATGQRGLVRPDSPSTWDAVQGDLIVQYAGGVGNHRIETAWISPPNHPGYVDQKLEILGNNGSQVFSNSRERGLTFVIPGETPISLKETVNPFYNATLLYSDGRRQAQGYGLDTLQRLFSDIAYTKWGEVGSYQSRLEEMMTGPSRGFGKVARGVVAAVEGVEEILADQVRTPGLWGEVLVNQGDGGLVFVKPGTKLRRVLYHGEV